MVLDYRNTNTLWASVAVETLVRLGLTTAIVCPGSRSTPLTMALASHSALEVMPILDERSAGFFAVGCAKRLRQPVVLVCTSGTAGANFYPAVIEASETGLPLLVLTADRPPEMRDCASGQTIDQQKLFGNFLNWYTEMATPVATAPMLAYLRQTMIHAWGKSQQPTPGPVHLNFPFRDPLSPLVEPEGPALAETLAKTLGGPTFFAAVRPLIGPQPGLLPGQVPWTQWGGMERGVIVAGPTEPENPEAYCQAVGTLSQQLGWPVLAEGLSPLRNAAPPIPGLISTYDSILRHPDWARDLKPDGVIQLGPLPTSKVLRQWLQAVQSPGWLVSAGSRNLDPLHGLTQRLPTSVTGLVADLARSHPPPCQHSQAYLKTWCDRNQVLRQHLDTTLAALDSFVESKIAWLLAQTLPPDTPLFIANSMPVRDVEWFWPPNQRRIQPYFNRGANGIDGTLSTALGLAHRNRRTVLLTGDLAFLHDTNGLLQVSKLQGHLTIVLINNQGGGIFEMLPIAQCDPPFEAYFATPQTVELEPLCKAYGVQYTLIKDWQQFILCLTNLPEQGVRLLEITTNRKADARWRQQLFQSLTIR
jgi:2-succinyl-5-enolpyruvyl-6-hydroxy-3-cyclohexene-1-carboxylate synthase